jgi:hypothetical protein
MTNADKQWILISLTASTYTYKFKGIYVDVPLTLFDQIRRDAKKELLDWFIDDLMWLKAVHPLDKIKAIGELQDKCRAKTLGEKENDDLL